ncbi:hypothetical protein FR943_19715 [Mycobacterium sp. TNTM28]|uniref:Exonuclease domain-containing protein n=1 Tax=[Mycobacterium] fortunisiensis TaxID=2600579 RepID=A0ABS6KRF2_9MYCO|nr:hypothetical protein [[Mycobacterium] fortunisiensis]
MCAKGWATASNGVVADQGSWLCRPPAGLEEFGPYNVRVHGITAETVADQPTFAERVPELLERLSTRLPIVAHNAVFDIGVLEQALATCGQSRPAIPHHCTRDWAKRLIQLPSTPCPRFVRISASFWASIMTPGTMPTLPRWLRSDSQNPSEPRPLPSWTRPRFRCRSPNDGDVKVVGQLHHPFVALPEEKRQRRLVRFRAQVLEPVDPIAPQHHGDRVVELP